MPDIRINARYEVLELLGEGGFGSVFKASRVADGRIFAVKFLRTASQDNRELFSSEMHLVSSLCHPNIVGVAEIADNHRDSNPYIVMEYCSGGDLHSLLQTRSRSAEPFTEPEVLAVFAQMVMALHYCHSCGNGKSRVIHRDLKPQNILLKGSHCVKIADFGLAKVLPKARMSTYSLVGTEKYLSPEMKRGDIYDHRVDMYGLGLILFEMCTFRLPKSTEPAQVCANLAREGNGRYSKTLTSAIADLLSADPLQRPTTERLMAMPIFAQGCHFKGNLFTPSLREQGKLETVEELTAKLRRKEDALLKSLKEVRDRERVLFAKEEAYRARLRRFKLHMALLPSPNLARVTCEAEDAVVEKMKELTI